MSPSLPPAAIVRHRHWSTDHEMQSLAAASRLFPARIRSNSRTHFVTLSVLFEDHSPPSDDRGSCHLRTGKAGCCATRTDGWLVSRLRHAGFPKRQSGSIGTPLDLPHGRTDSRGKPCGGVVHLQADHTLARAGHEPNAFEGLRDIFCVERLG